MIAENLNKIVKELPSGVKLVAVSKFHPFDDILEAYSAGQRCFAESRPQEFAEKVKCAEAASINDIEWHFIGHLQTNKLKLVLPYASLVQSVDSRHLLEEINKWALANRRRMDVLLELHIAAEETKQGFTEEEILELMFAYSDGKFQGVRIRGLMGMATNTDDFETVSADFERIDSFMAYLVDLFPEADGFDQLSTGMSDDYKIALQHGSTMVRVGTAIFGARK